MDKDRKYAVVEFSEENSCGVIPSTWLTKNGNYCVYPDVPIFKTNHLIESCHPPAFDGSWNQCKVRIFAYSGTYLKARQKAARAELTSNVESDDDHEKRRRIKRKSSPTESESELSDTPVKKKKGLPRKQPPSSKTDPKKLFKSINIPKAPLNKKIVKLPPKPVVSPPIPTTTESIPRVRSERNGPSFVLAEGSGTSRIDEENNLSASTAEHTENNVASLQPPGSPSRPINSQNVELGNDLTSQLFTTRTSQRDLFSETPSTELNEKGFRATVLRALASIQTDIKEIRLIQSATNSRPLPPVNLNVQLPVNSKDDYYAFNTWLLTTENKSSLIERDLSLIGGEDLQAIVHGILFRLIGPVLTAQMTFTGKNGKVKLKDTNVYSLILDAVRTSELATGATNKRIKVIVQKWLYGGSDRDGGRENRRKQQKISANQTEENSETSEGADD